MIKKTTDSKLKNKESSTQNIILKIILFVYFLSFLCVFSINRCPKMTQKVQIKKWLHDSSLFIFNVQSTENIQTHIILICAKSTPFILHHHALPNTAYFSKKWLDLFKISIPIEKIHNSDKDETESNLIFCYENFKNFTFYIRNTDAKFTFRCILRYAVRQTLLTINS